LTSWRSHVVSALSLTSPNLIFDQQNNARRAGPIIRRDVGDGVLAPGEVAEVTFRIILNSTAPFRFVVNVRGDPQP
jgi:hypothetical protein